jgi:GH15 family glucan-1,4-alpha-glucosidase
LGVVFGVNGETDLKERLLSHLEGYLGSKPVRRGNCAHAQRQIDVYGEVLDWALLYETLGGSLNKNSRTMLATLADFVADHWREPDQDLWEMRGPLRHHVHGKIMSWVALDRALKLLQRNPRWEREREAIVAEVSARTDCRLAQTYDRKDMDAALLLTATSAFPIASQILENTVRAVESELRFGDFVYRYRTDDGVRGQAGAFLICSFWLVDALLHLGRRKEAGEIFDRLIESANDVGLYSEAIDPTNRAFLGNFLRPIRISR